ncbi:MAG: hypothetical protein A3G76_15100 [Acidobacteria bacterium RIFCSPLOWO2_12_FULL_65_11]|nr:MAG: hypothetical protein A3H95_02460 [Acidobacteria bacterium RIFCSPLOWO2_02_FULL_64_15]OFW28977.1 MAG: hypothetical protein A3G76_15100 [Acidobacteria bacterium RIFCSPLOWO2_12_FULL_65_11]
MWIVKDKRFKTGATIPYILAALRIHRGADNIASPEMSERELRDLLIAMRDDLPAPDCIPIQHCSHIDAYVATWHPTQLQSRDAIRSPHHSDRALYHCGKIDDHEIHDFESLVGGLWSTHQDYILNGYSSRIKTVDLNGKPVRRWVAIDDSEREEIRRTLAHPKERTRSN